MRIAHLTHQSTFFGGGEQSLAEILTEATIPACTTCLMAPPGELASALRERKVLVFELNTLQGLNTMPAVANRWRLLRDLYRLPGAVLEVRSLVRSFRADILHCHSLGALLIAVAARRLLGMTAAILYHYRTPSRHPLITALLGSVDHIVFISRADQDDLLARGMKTPSSVVYNAVTRPPSAATMPAAPDRPLTILVPGMLAHHKGQHVAIAAAHYLKRRQHERDLPPWRLAIRGPVWSGRGYLDELTELVETCGLGAVVEIDPRRVDRGELYRGADIVVIPSLAEPFGRACVEAMSLGIPVIASDVGGLREILAGVEAGILVPQNAPTALGQALELLLLQPHERSEMGQRGIQAWRDRFSLERLGSELSALYQGVLRSSK